MALAEKNRDLLKMFAGTLVTVIAGVWFLAHELHTIKSDLKKDIHSVSSDLKDDIHSVGTDMHSMELRLNEKIAGIDKRVTVIETVLMYQRCPMNHIATAEPKPNE